MPHPQTSNISKSKELTEQVRRVRCPYCHAAPGERCRTSGGQWLIRQSCHAERVIVWQEHRP